MKKSVVYYRFDGKQYQKWEYKSNNRVIGISVIEN